MIKLSKASEEKLKGVHPDLVRVVRKAASICDQPFVVFEGVRTVERQRSLIAKGFSKLKNPFRSRHVPSKDPKYGMVSHAVDLVPLNASGQPVWDWKLIPPILRAMKSAAMAEKVTIECGAEWKTFKDGPHYQLPWRLYP